MHCFFIVGAGRSGTSLVASLFRRLAVAPLSSFSPREANPLGFYEDVRVNAINESILSRYVPRAPSYDPCGYGADTPSQGHYWLARIGLQNIIKANEAEQHDIRSVVGTAGFCIKDPRLSYTYSCWQDCLSREQVQSLKSICVFRNPAHVLNSVLREIMLADYLHAFAVSRDQVLASWCLHYQRIIKQHAQGGKWFFCEYESLLNGKSMDALEQFCQVDLDRSVIRQDLNRSCIDISLNASVRDLYRDLQRLALQSNEECDSSLVAQTSEALVGIPVDVDGCAAPGKSQSALFVQSKQGRKRVVMTLLCRNEIDIIRSHLDFHLTLGVDHIVVTDNASTDGTREVLQEYERLGKITLILEEELIHDQAIWVTRMARLAKQSLQADWLLHSDADEFWLPGCLSISDYFQDLDPALKQLDVPRSNMLPAPLEKIQPGIPFYVRQVIREVDSLDNLGDPIMGKVCHQAMEGVEVDDGNHAFRIDGQLQECQPAVDFEIIHYPVRSLEQLERKIKDGSDALARNNRVHPLAGITWRELRKRLDTEGSLASYYNSLCMDLASIRAGLQAGTLVKEDRIFRLLTKKASRWLMADGASA